MYTKTRYSFYDVVKWTRFETYVFIVLALIPVVLHQAFDMKWLRLPWTAIAVIGTAVAFVVGFQNNAAYGRIWEARKIWGGIVNYSRSWTMLIKDMVAEDHCKEPVAEQDLKDHVKILVHRHIAWLTALRHSMRETRPWEVFLEHRSSSAWSNAIYTPEWKHKLTDDLKPYLSESEQSLVLSRKNRATAILGLQSSHLKKLKDKGIVWEFAFLELEKVLVELFNLQGKTERIKNFPYPRQYATISHQFVWIFIALIPLAVLPEFANVGDKLKPAYPIMGHCFVWFSVPFSVIISWVFHTMERIGRSGENPFEGTANDVPISAISRGIEIDIRQMIGEPNEDIPEPFPVYLNTQM